VFPNSVPLHFGSGSFSVLQWPSRCKQKIFFANYGTVLTEESFPSVVKDSKFLRSPETVESKVLLDFFAC
jgi:hypothetical protein